MPHHRLTCSTAELVRVIPAIIFPVTLIGDGDTASVTAWELRGGAPCNVELVTGTEILRAGTQNYIYYSVPTCIVRNGPNCLVWNGVFVRLGIPTITTLTFYILSRFKYLCEGIKLKPFT